MVELGGLHAELLHAVDVAGVLRYRIGGSLSHGEQVQRAAIPAVEEQLVACSGMVVGLGTKNGDSRGAREEKIVSACLKTNGCCQLPAIQARCGYLHPKCSTIGMTVTWGALTPRPLAYGAAARCRNLQQQGMTRPAPG